LLARRGLVAARPMPSSSRLHAPSSMPRRQASSPGCAAWAAQQLERAQWLRRRGLASARAGLLADQHAVALEAASVRSPLAASTLVALAALEHQEAVVADGISRRPLRAEVTDSPALLREDEDVARVDAVGTTRARRRTRGGRRDESGTRPASRATGPSAAGSGRAVPGSAVAPGPDDQQQQPITSSTGQAVRSTGRTKRDRPTPLANQITISLSRYMRPSVTTMATNSDSASIVGRWPSAV
jgi:hypothetical protein